MKTFALVFLSLFLTKSCQSKKDAVEAAQIKEAVKTAETETAISKDKIQENTVVEYEALSRGFYKKITLQNNQVTVVSDRNEGEKGKIITLSKEEASEMCKLLKGVNLEGLGKLKAPTDKRMYDGAAHANLIVTVNGKVYSGTGFDHGFPPAEIEKLVTKLLSFSEDK